MVYGLYFTDNLHYLEVKSSFDSNPIKFQTPETTKFSPTAKKRFFNADNNNVPFQDIIEEQQHLKFDRKLKTNEFERDQQYENINAVIDENFNPNRYISTTYLWDQQKWKTSRTKR